VLKSAVFELGESNFWFGQCLPIAIASKVSNEQDAYVVRRRAMFEVCASL